MILFYKGLNLNHSLND